MKTVVAGFTLIELISVVVIIGALSTAVFIKWPSFSINVPAQAAQLANDLRYTQSLSLSQGQRFRLVISSATTYQILNSSGVAILNASGNTTTTLGTGISFGTLTNLPNNLVAFDSRGVPYSDSGLPGTA